MKFPRRRRYIRIGNTFFFGSHPPSQREGGREGGWGYGLSWNDYIWGKSCSRLGKMFLANTFAMKKSFMIKVMIIMRVRLYKGYLTSILNDAIILSIHMSANRFAICNSLMSSPFLAAKFSHILAVHLSYLALFSKNAGFRCFHSDE
jgi:hypothetical protein